MQYSAANTLVRHYSLLDFFLTSVVNSWILSGCFLISFTTVAGPIIVKPSLLPKRRFAIFDLSFSTTFESDSGYIVHISMPLKFDLLICSIVLLSRLILLSGVKYCISLYGINCNVNIFFSPHHVK